MINRKRMLAARIPGVATLSAKLKSEAKVISK
jgi:hypothetical protein